MNLYLISVSAGFRPRTFDCAFNPFISAVVIAENEEEAQFIYPGGGDLRDSDIIEDAAMYWTTDANAVDVVYLGVAEDRLCLKFPDRIINVAEL